MRKFVINTRAVPLTVMEVEGEIVSALEDPSVIWLPENEYKFRIMKPDSLLEMKEVVQPDGTKKKNLVPVVYCSHSVYDSKGEVLLAAHAMIKQGLEFEVRKGRLISYSEEDLQYKYAEIKEVMLP